MMWFLAQQAEMPQSEYALAWALIAGLMFLGFLIVTIPRPREHDLPENIRKQQLSGKSKSGKGKKTGGSAPISTFSQRLRK
jgi:hypothetical protein